MSSLFSELIRLYSTRDKLKIIRSCIFHVLHFQSPLSYIVYLGDIKIELEGCI